MRPRKVLVLIAGIFCSLVFFWSISNGNGIMNSLLLAIFLPPGFGLLAIPVIFILALVGMMLLELMFGIWTAVKKVIFWVKKLV